LIYHNIKFKYIIILQWIIIPSTIRSSRKHPMFSALSASRVTRFFSSLRRLNNYQARSARSFFRRRNIWKRATGMKTENQRAALHSLSLSLSLSPLFIFYIFMTGYESGINIASPSIFQRYAGASASRVCVVDKAERFSSIARR